MLAYVRRREDGPPAGRPQPAAELRDAGARADAPTDAPRIDIRFAPPALLAVRTDGAPWQVLAPTGDHYGLPVLGPRFSILVVCADQVGQEIELVHATHEDRLDLVTKCRAMGPSVALAPHFAPGDARQRFELDEGISYCAPETRACEFPPATYEGYAFHGEGPALRMKILPDLQVTDHMGVIDADASRGFAPEVAHLTLRYPRTRSRRFGNDGGAMVCFVNRGGGGTLCDQPHGELVDDAITLSYRRVPAAERRPGDCDLLEAAGLVMCLDDRAPRAPPTIELEDWSRPAARFDRAALRLTWDAVPGDSALRFELGDSYKPLHYRVMATGLWLAGSVAGSYQLEDLTTVPGWQATWAPPRHQKVDVAVGRGTAPLIDTITDHQDLWARPRPGDRIQWIHVDVAD